MAKGEKTVEVVIEKLPVLSWRDVVKALSKKDFKVVRQKVGHLILEGPEHKFTVVPRHETIAPATLIKILAQAGLTKEELARAANLTVRVFNITGVDFQFSLSRFRY